MSRSQSYSGGTDKHWLSRLLDDAAFPVLSLAVAVSQLNVGHDDKDASRQFHRQANEVQVDNGSGEGADKYNAHAATESSRFKEKTGSEKELTRGQ